LASLLQEFYKDSIISQSFQPLNQNSFAFFDEDITHSETLSFIKGLPMYDPPQIFGFHENANITKELNETNLLCSNLLDIGDIEGTLRKTD